MSSCKKPAAKGPFFFYMLEFRRKQESKGKTFSGGMEQVMQEAGPSWNRLTDRERQVYKDLAVSHKKSSKSNYGEKYTAQGIPFSQVEMEKQELLTKQQNIEAAVSEMIQTAVNNHMLEQMQMNFISVNYFCKTSNDVYIPAELALVRYNLETGILDKFNELINPGKLPLGMALEATQFSDETHELPIPPHAIGETDLDDILQKILSFVDCSNKIQNRVLLITEESQIQAIESILEQCCDDSKVGNQFLVIPLGLLFFYLKRATEKYGLDICTFPSKGIADILLKKDIYEYTNNIACNFHEEKGNSRFCALSKATRWTYIISDNCCLDLSIDLIPGCHLPLNADTTLNLNFGETTSYTSQGQSDGFSTVSSIQTNYTLPVIYQQRSVSPCRNKDDVKDSVATWSCKPSKIQKKAVASAINPFHRVGENLSFDQDLPSKSAQNIDLSIKKDEITDTEPKIEIFRHPAVMESGRGRGALLINTSVISRYQQQVNKKCNKSLAVGTNNTTK